MLYYDDMICCELWFSIYYTICYAHMNFKFLTYFQISGSNLQYEGDDNLIDRSFGFLDQENYSPTYHGMRPQMFNCRSEPAIPPRLNMEALSQVKSINFQLSVRASVFDIYGRINIHISFQPHELDLEFNSYPQISLR